ELHKRKLLYRAKRLVNWDPKFQTAISDLEVENREVAGHMWHFKYPLAGGETYTYVERDEDGKVRFEEERDYISIATTRPETMLGDGAVAVHPDDARYRPIVGKLCEIPVGPKEHRRLIPIITDEYPDPNFGSGAVKITGAHDLNDHGVAERNNIPMYRLMDGKAAMRTDGLPYAEAAERAKAIAKGASASADEINQLNLVPEAYRGLDRYIARERVVADIDSEGLMIAVEDKMIMQPFGDRSGLVIEPMLTDQWYVDAATLAKPAIEAVRSGDIAVVPETWKKTWFNWLENIQPWCVSRQLWWGHRIPAWYGPLASPEGVVTSFAQKVFVAETEAQLLTQTKDYYGANVAVTLMNSRSEAFVHPKGVGDFPDHAVLFRDEDVLDTWFSSALWPFATLGWPDQTDELARHYPNDVLISGFDIIFFWDARMAMQGFEFMGERPWKTLYLHGLVRDAKGQKMSKSKSNTVDPLGLIDRYGADALRFTMAAMESQGRDIKLDEKRVEGYRNFATKLWNAARFLQGNGVGASQSIAAPEATLPVNRWIIGEVVETLSRLNKAFDELRFDGMADAIYHFTWGTFCDWYVELVKGSFDDETRAVAAWAFDQILVMLHPFMPFVTEELWASMGKRPYDLILAKWPAPEAEVDTAAKAELDWLIRLVGEIRSARTELNVPPGAKLNLFAGEADETVSGRLDRQFAALQRLARLGSIQLSEFSGSGAAQVVVDGASYALPLEGVIDLDAERSRLKKAVEVAAKDRDSLAARLANPAFTERAKPEAVDKARADHGARAAEAERLSAALKRLG
ncbi:MAG: valine--tRNA ligase, partial [Sphingomicrobium sp.]